MNASSRGTFLRALMGVTAAAAVLLAAGCVEQGGVTSASSGALTQENVIPTGQACAPTGKHLEHRAFGCATCHQCEGTLSFDAGVAGADAAFDATTKSCSSVACHAVPAGTFTYYRWDWATETSVAVTVPYGGQPPPPANWYAAPGTTCGVCHDYPPTYGGARYDWHTGMHGLNVPNGNACQLCHPDATGAYVYGGLPSYVNTSGGLITSCATGTFCSAPGTITNPSLHANGVLDVTPTFTSSCFGCH